MKKIYSSILVSAFFILVSTKLFSQGIVNHLTMSIENCTLVNSNTYQFDLLVVSDGVNISDLRPNNFQFGVNFDSCILQSGAAVTPFYVPNTSDFFGLNAINFPTSSFINHIRISEGAFSGGNTGLSMVVGHQYRYGTFRITSSLNYTNCCPNFTLQDSTASGKTATAAIVWIGNSSSSTIFDIDGPGDTIVNPNVHHQRTLKSTCTCTNGININTVAPLISFFPNPSTDMLNIILFDNNRKAEIKIISLLGRVSYSVTVNEQHATIDVSVLSDGVYILEATIGNNVSRFKFIKGQ